jgi:outer membrane protein
MKKWFLVVLIAALGSVAGAQTSPAAPAAPAQGTQGSAICFVNAQSILEGNPDGAKVLEARKAAAAELQPLVQQIQALQQKIQAGSATAAERQQYDTLVKTYQARSKALQDAQNKLLEPITKAVDAAVAKVAAARGCVVVLDRQIAASSGLVVYADPSTDITQDVIAEVQRAK